MSIHQTPGGQYRAKWRDPSGRQRSKNFTTKRDARDFLASVRTSTANGTYVDPQAGRVRFAEHATAWLASRSGEATTRARDTPAGGSATKARTDRSRARRTPPR